MSPAAAHFDFDAVPKKAPSCTFTLGGRDWSCRNSDDVPFQTLEQLTTLDPEQDAKGALMQIAPFFQSMLVEDEVDDFMTMLRSPKSALTVGMLQPLMKFISESVFGHPTQPSKPSQRGRPATGRTSKGRSSSRATPKARAS
jgi:hypothetical protein